MATSQSSELEEGGHLDASSITAQQSARQRLEAAFEFKVRLHSRKKAKHNDPKASSSSNGEDLPRSSKLMPLIRPHDESGEDPRDDFPLVAEDHKLTSATGNGEIDVLSVGYLRTNLDKYDALFDMHWQEAIDITATRAQSSILADHDHNAQVGFCAAKLIRKKSMCQVFHRMMSTPFDESTLMAFNLFDQYGQLRDHWKLHEHLKGSAAWQDQLDVDDILFIDDIVVDKAYQRRGLATAMIETLFAATRRKTKSGNFAAILWPQSCKEEHFQDLLRTLVAPSGGLFRAGIIDQCDSVATPWARSLGFRRIGLSMWFGLLCQGGTASAIIPAEDDHDPHILEPAKNLLPKSVQDARSDQSFLAIIKGHFRRVDAQDLRWLATDKERNTVLHIASLHFYPKSISWIMQQSCSKQLANMWNSSRLTPLEAMEHFLEAARTRTFNDDAIIVKAGYFEGYTLVQAMCLAFLREAQIDSVEDFEQFRYGCTCNECGDGYISPRMNHALWSAALSQRGMLEDDLVVSEWAADEDDFNLFCLPTYTKKYVARYKAFRRGLVKVCGHIEECKLSVPL